MLVVSLVFTAVPSLGSDCVEYKIVDHGDSVEAVCIGKPQTEAEKQEDSRQRAIRDQQNAKIEQEEAYKRKRQSPPEDFDKCYRETFAKTTFSGILGISIAKELARELCGMSIERKECVMKMIGGKQGNLMGFSVIYNNALEACPP